MSANNTGLLTFWSEERPASLFPLTENAKAWLMIVGTSQCSISDLQKFLSPGGSSGKTSPVSFPLTEDGSLPPSFPGWSGAGLAAGGEFWMLHFSESPSGAVVCSLSDVLEDNGGVPGRYFLTPAEARKMIARYEKYGAAMPPEAKRVMGSLAGRETPLPRSAPA
jgi:hypothetical protein